MDSQVSPFLSRLPPRQRDQGSSSSSTNSFPVSQEAVRSLFNGNPKIKETVTKVRTALTGILNNLQAIVDSTPGMETKGPISSSQLVKRRSVSSTQPTDRRPTSLISRSDRPFHFIENMQSFFKLCRKILWSNLEEDLEKKEKLKVDKFVWEKDIKNYYDLDFDKQMQELFRYATLILENTTAYNLKMRFYRKWTYLFLVATLLFTQIPSNPSDSKWKRYPLKGSVWGGSVCSLISLLYMMTLSGENSGQQTNCVRQLRKGITIIQSKADSHMVLPVGK